MNAGQRKIKMTNENLRLSVSKVKTFSGCKKQFKYNYIDKLPQKERDYLITGKFAHEILEKFHNYYIEGCLLPYNIAMGDAFKSALSSYKDQLTPAMKKEVWTMIDQYLRLITDDRKNGKKFNVLNVEKRFDLKIADDINLVGAIDKIEIDGDNILHVGDYKTTKNLKYLKGDWLQLLTYAYVLLQEDPTIKKIRGSYIALRHNFEKITKEFDIKEILTVKGKFEKYAELIRAETEYAANPSPLCAYCSFLEHCEDGKAKCPMAAETFGEVKW